MCGALRHVALNVDILIPGVDTGQDVSLNLRTRRREGTQLSRAQLSRDAGHLPLGA